MALRGALTHRKTRRLARILGIAPCFALGILEAMWHVTATQAPTGAIGRLSDEEFADQLGYTHDETKLIAALVEAGFLEENRQHRLIVHDWHVHSDNTLDAQLYRRGEHYANGSIPRGTKIGAAEKAALTDRFYKNPAASLFPEDPELPLVEAPSAVQTSEQPSNVIAFRSAPDGADKRLPEPVPEPVPDPAPVPTNPLPPARRGTRREMREEVERAKSTVAGQAIDRVSRTVVNACGFSGTAALRLQVAIWQAIDAECRRRDEPPEKSAAEIGVLMVNNYREWSRYGQFLRYTWSPQKFFAEGHWCNPNAWPYDRERLDRARDLAVGANY